MKIIGVHHPSYTVSNLERSLEFYVGLLGCEMIWQREISNQYFRDIVGYPDCVVVTESRWSSSSRRKEKQRDAS